MNAVLYSAFREPLRLETVSDPTPPDGGVVVRVKATGLCRSDWHGWQGHDSDIQTLPHVPGHELAGEIAAVGRGVRGWRVGDRVTTPFVLACGDCPSCRAGDQQVCERQWQPGFHGWGSFADYVALPQADGNLVRLPDGLDEAEAAVLGCRFATSFRGLAAQGRVRGGEWVVVYGCGGVGLSAVMIAVAFGAQVIAVDLNPERLAMAMALGATRGLNVAETDAVPAAVIELTAGGAHVSVDALGSARTCRDAILSLRRRGRHIQIGLLAGDQANPAVPMGTVIGRELEILGSHGMAAHAYPDMLAMILSGRLPVGRLIGSRISLAAAPAALAEMNHFPGAGITIIEP